MQEVNKMAQATLEQKTEGIKEKALNLKIGEKAETIAKFLGEKHFELREDYRFCSPRIFDFSFYSFKDEGINIKLEVSSYTRDYMNHHLSVSTCKNDIKKILFFNIPMGYKEEAVYEQERDLEDGKEEIKVKKFKEEGEWLNKLNELYNIARGIK